jgi:uncharacterized phiE125 gp8 family phage protein
MYSVLAVPPAVEPVTLAEAKAQCRVLHNAEDSLIDGLIPAARQYAEEYTRRAFITQTWRVTLDRFPAGKIYLPRAPLIDVTEVRYTDAMGASQVVAGVLTGVDAKGEFVAPAYGTDWPIARDTYGAVTVTFQAGYGLATTDVPAPIKQAILIRVDDLYQHRGSITTGTIVAHTRVFENLLSHYRLPTVP